MEDIKIFELKRADLRGATVIDGFPSVGLVSTITANYLISTLKMEQIGILDSMHFPTVSVVRGSEPLNPVRIYTNSSDDSSPDSKIVVFISEFQPPSNLIKMIAATILDWAEDQGCKLLISPEGLVIDRGEGSAGDDPDEQKKKPKSLEDLVAYGIGSTKNARDLIEKHEIVQFQEGVISGVAGVLLNEGKRRAFDVISILAEARPNYPDARAAAKVIEAIDKLLLKIDIDVEPLLSEAAEIEAKIMSMQKQAKPPSERPTAPIPDMYG